METLANRFIHNHAFSRLHATLNPRSVAVIGASSTFGKWGQMIITNIVAGGFPGKVFPVNPKQEKICGLPAYRTITDIPEPVDLVFITTPARTVPTVLHACAEKGVKGVVAITAGFRETGEAGEKLEKQVISICHEKDITLIGPNTMGMMCPHINLFGTGPHTRPKKGPVAFISQSGNLGNQLIHWAEQQGIGISLFVGSGNESVLTCSDYLEYLENDQRTEIIVLYIEGLKEGRRFYEIASRVNRAKPIIILKGGRTEAGQSAAASHSGAMAGQFATFKTACRQAGLSIATMPSELLDLSAGFSCLPLPRGNRVGIVTLGGGWGVVTSDECNEMGLIVPEIPDSAIEVISRYLPPFWSKANPVDMVGTREYEIPLVAVEELLKCDVIDAVITLGIVGRKELIHLLVKSTSRVEPSIPLEILEDIDRYNQEYEKRYITRIVELMEIYKKPVIGVSLSTRSEGIVRRIDGSKYCGVFYQTPENAVNVLAKMVAYQGFLKSL